MNSSQPPQLPMLRPAPSQEAILRKLFLTLFLRGKNARGLKKDARPPTLASKLGATLLIYALVGLVAIVFAKQPVFGLSLYLHGMTTLFLGMFIAASAGEVLFNKEETDILMHRPVTTQALLTAKVTVMVQVSLWLAGAFNLIGFVVGMNGAGGLTYLFAHALSTTLEALFCTDAVVLMYQLCLRWFGRERLDNLMTLVQVLVTIAIVMGGQIVPHLLRYLGPGADPGAAGWWIFLVPPAWFAGLDDVIAGQRTSTSWMLAGCGMVGTAAVLWLAFDRLAKSYETGLQTLNEAKAIKASPPGNNGDSWLVRLVRVPPLNWWLKDPVSRVSFQLTVAYLLRDRDVKLRIYPAIAPMLIMPIFFLVQGLMRGGDGGLGDGFALAFAGSYLALIPLQSLNLLQFSQQWQAADIFRQTPVAGPGAICHGTRRAVLLLLTLPVLIVFLIVGWFVVQSPSMLVLLLPGLITLPVAALIPHMGGESVPFSEPIDGAKNTRQGVLVFGVTFGSMALSGLAIWAHHQGWIGWFLAAQTVAAAVIYAVLRKRISETKWSASE